LKGRPGGETRPSLSFSILPQKNAYFIGEIMSPEPNHIDAAIADLEGWMERIATAVETLKMFRSGGGALPAGVPSSPPTRSPTNGEIRHDTFFQMTVPDAAEKFLALAKKTIPTSAMAEGLLKGGLKSAAKNFPSMLNTILTRDSRFVKVNREWGLDAWYPGMRKGPSRKRDGTPTETRPANQEKEKSPNSNIASDSRGFGPNSLRGRTLTLLRSEASTLFDAPTIATRLSVDNVPSVSAALSGLLKVGMVKRPEKGRYQIK
jgi:hypothetical protein